MAAAAAAANPSHLLLSHPSPSHFTSTLSPFPLQKPSPSFSKRNTRNPSPSSPFRCAVTRIDETAAKNPPPATKKKSSFLIQTLTSWLLKQEQAGSIDAELTIVLSSISMACKQIASLVQRAGISNLTGIQGNVNVQGEDQKKLDVVSNEVFSNCLRSSGRTGIIASEEEDVPVAVEESYSGNYIVVFDPLDGSSNIDAAVSTGSIFGIYSPNDECLADVDEDGMARAGGGEGGEKVLSNIISSSRASKSLLIMAEKFEEGDTWLPAEFLGEGFFLEGRRAAALMPGSEKRNGLVRENASLSYPNMVMETESDEEDYVAGLTRKMARSILVEDSTSSFWDTRVLATSPQSTLCDAGIWSASCTGRQNVCSKASPPLSAFLEQRKEDAMDLFYAAAGEILRNKQNEQRAPERYQRKNLLVDTKSLAIAGSHSNQVLERQRIQAAQFYRLKQQQLIKQQLSSTWTRQNKAAAATTTSIRPHGLASSPWSALPQPQQQQQPQPQPSSGMRALFLNSTGARRESAGTGVFLPRRAGSPTAKKPACSTVLLPAKVVQALNLTLDDAGIQPRFPAHIARDHETATLRINPGNNEQKRNIYQPTPASISGHEILLPKEWTY